MRIGTDVSIAECRREGYPVMDYKKRELFPKKLGGAMDKGAYVNISISFPENWNDSGKPILGETFLYIFNGEVCWEDLLEIYVRRRDNINSMAGIGGEDGTPLYDEIENPSEYDLLNLASDINSYCGLE